MVEKSTQLSRDNLVGFLEFVADKNLMKSETVSGYKKACNVVLKILDDEEAADLSKIDLESVFQRHRNFAAGRVKPATLKTYELRTRAAINAFLEYAKDPSSWRPGVKARAPRVTKVQAKASRTTGKSKESEQHVETPSQPSIYVDFQIHISPEATPEQIDQIFASMRRHLYGNRTGK
jgi:hypothetical protein